MARRGWWVDENCVFYGVSLEYLKEAYTYWLNKSNSDNSHGGTKALRPGAKVHERTITQTSLIPDAEYYEHRTSWVQVGPYTWRACAHTGLPNLAHLAQYMHMHMHMHMCMRMHMCMLLACASQVRALARSTSRR